MLPPRDNQVIGGVIPEGLLTDHPSRIPWIPDWAVERHVRTAPVMGMPTCQHGIAIFDDCQRCDVEVDDEYTHARDRYYR